MPPATLFPMDPLRLAYGHPSLVCESPLDQAAPPDALLSISAFARRSRLSMKALRLYERLGLLTPARVDRGNGYRHYRESQLATARLVAMLRRLDMPLPTAHLTSASETCSSNWCSRSSDTSSRAG